MEASGGGIQTVIAAEARNDIDVVVVTYNSAEVIVDCLKALEQHPPSGASRVVVIDNCSRDDAVTLVRERFPQVEVIENERNVGLAAAWNLAIRHSNSDYVLLLNPDTRVVAGAIDALVHHIETRPAVGAVGPQLVGLDGQIQLSCRAFPNLLAVLLRGTKLETVLPKTPSLRKYLMTDWDHGQARAVDWLLGACILLRRDALESVGLFDDGFFLYYEDIDWCYRAWAAGWQIHYVPRARVVHHYQRESARGLNRQFFHHLHSIARLFLKHPLPLW
jgi:GT2 family glycosyltransferase